MLRPAGFFLRKELGDSYVSLGTLLGDGEILALHEEPSGCFSEQPERFQLTGVSYNSGLWEHSLAVSFSGQLTWIQTNPSVSGEKKLIRSFLGSYDPAQGDIKHEIEIVPAEEFDALIFDAKRCTDANRAERMSLAHRKNHRSLQDVPRLGHLSLDDDLP